MEIALEILMNVHKTNDGEAFALHPLMSRHLHRKVHDVAEIRTGAPSTAEASR